MSEQTLPVTGRAWHLEARPMGWPVPSDFAPGDHGLENTLDAFLALMRGENTGKMIVKL